MPNGIMEFTEFSTAQVEKIRPSVRQPQAQYAKISVSSVLKAKQVSIVGAG